jgi:hypothetical protein
LGKPNFVEGDDEWRRTSQLDGDLTRVNADRINQVLDQRSLFCGTRSIPQALEIEVYEQCGYLVELVYCFVAGLLVPRKGIGLLLLLPLLHSAVDDLRRHESA